MAENQMWKQKHEINLLVAIINAILFLLGLSFMTFNDLASLG